LSSNKGADFGVVLSSLADIGAITQEYAVLDAQYFGVPQRRRRIFLVSVFCPTASERCPDPLLPLIQGSRGDFAKGRKARKDSARLVEAGIDPGNGETNYPYVKSRRAQTNTDDETWVEGDVTPTLNAFDNGGETRATVLMPVNMPLSELGPTLTTTYGAKNYSNHQEVMSGSIMPVAYSIREDAKANNFSVTETDTALCLNGLVPSTQSHHAQIFIAEPIIFENSYRDGPRVGDDICHTLPAKMGLGGGNTPMLAEVTYSFDTQFGSNAAVFEDTSPTLKSSQQPPSVSIAFSHYSSNASPSIEVSPTLRSGTNGTGHAVLTSPGLAVRRLTPLECERLQGWPDDHTRWTADGKEQADTNRYKQCGNGVASPVAKWVGEQLRPVLETE
jgi:site-specific DNA-cytosine methylase